MADLNNVIISGRLGADPETSYLPSGGMAGQCSIAVGEQWKDKRTGEKKERTDWITIKCFDKTAELLGEYVKKGDEIIAIGRMRQDTWEDSEGKRQYRTYVLMDRLKFGAKGRQAEQRESRERNAAPPPPPQGDFDDDIPF